MAVTLRTGTYGNYFGNEQGSSNALTYEQEKMNAEYIYRSLSASGWSINAISAMLGNMQSESSINPGRWQSNNVGNLSGGFGLVQWTPASKYIDWVSIGDYTSMDNNLLRINYEVENNVQWIATSNYNYSFSEFKTSTDSPYTLALAFIANYERPANPNQPERGEQAEEWYRYLTGVSPDIPVSDSNNKKKNFKWVLYARKLRGLK